MTPKIVLCTIVLNEMEWLSSLYLQHKDWLGLTKWAFVEMADPFYAKANPDMVTSEGLSTDGTTAFLEKLAAEDSRVVHIKHGFSKHASPDQGKCQAKNRFLREADRVKPDYLIVLDADEFYTKQHQTQLTWTMIEHRADAYILRRREIWRPPAISKEPLFSREVIGGFWAIPCCHWWRWYPGMEYIANHNTPSQGGSLMTHKRVKRLEGPHDPQMVHMGFAASLKTRKAKNDYYIERGEGKTDSRLWYVRSRKSWEEWQPQRNIRLLKGAKVVPYSGPIPEIFR